MAGPLHHRADPGFMSLPDGVLATILAMVPFGKAKVGMQGVARQWRRVLSMHEAHSKEELEEDQPMPQNVHIVEGGRTKISVQFMGAIRVCISQHVHGPFSLAWLPPQLEVLGLGYLFAPFEENNCPVLPGLRKLVFSAVSPSPLPLLSQYFPNLQEIKVEFCDTVEDADEPNIWRLGMPGKEEFLADLRSLTSLRHIEFEDVRYLRSGEKVLLEEFSVAPDCRVDYSLMLTEGDLDFSEFTMPPGLANHLKSFSFVEPSSVDFRKSDALSLALFSECKFLEEITFTTYEPGPGLAFINFDRLPETCRTVTIGWDGGEFKSVDSAIPLIQPCEGWQTSLSRTAGEIMVFRATN